MKIKNLLITALVLATTVPVLYADLSVSSTPVTRVRADGFQELVGAVRFTVVAPASGNIGTVSLDYGVPVSANSIIQVATTGNFVVPAGNVQVSGGVVTVFVISAGGVGDSFTVSGVRVDAFAGGFTVLDASVSSSFIPIVAGQTNPRVVNGSAPSKSVASIIPVTILSDATIVTGTGNITIVEGFASAWGNIVQEGLGATNGYQIRLTVNGLPTGVHLALAIGGNTSVTLSGLNISTPILTSIANTSVIDFSFGGTSRSDIEALEITYTYINAGPTLPLTPGTFNITATAFPPFGTPSFVIDEMGDLPALEVLSGCTLLLTSAYSGGTLDLEIGLVTGEPSTWNLWLSVRNNTVRLLSIPVPSAVATIPISIPGFPQLGTIGILTTITTSPGGIGCSQWQTVDTGPEAVVLSPRELQELFRGIGP